MKKILLLVPLISSLTACNSGQGNLNHEPTTSSNFANVDQGKVIPIPVGSRELKIIAVSMGSQSSNIKESFELIDNNKKSAFASKYAKKQNAYNLSYFVPNSPKPEFYTLNRYVENKLAESKVIKVSPGSLKTQNVIVFDTTQFTQHSSKLLTSQSTLVGDIHAPDPINLLYGLAKGAIGKIPYVGGALRALFSSIVQVGDDSGSTADLQQINEEFQNINTQMANLDKKISDARNSTLAFQAQYSTDTIYNNSSEYYDQNIVPVETVYSSLMERITIHMQDAGVEVNISDMAYIMDFYNTHPIERKRLEAYLDPENLDEIKANIFRVLPGYIGKNPTLSPLYAKLQVPLQTNLTFIMQNNIFSSLAQITNSMNQIYGQQIVYTQQMLQQAAIINQIAVNLYTSWGVEDNYYSITNLDTTKIISTMQFYQASDQWFPNNSIVDIPNSLAGTESAAVLNFLKDYNNSFTPMGARQLPGGNYLNQSQCLIYDWGLEAGNANSGSGILTYQCKDHTGQYSPVNPSKILSYNLTKPFIGNDNNYLDNFNGTLGFNSVDSDKIKISTNILPDNHNPVDHYSVVLSFKSTVIGNLNGSVSLYNNNSKLAVGIWTSADKPQTITMIKDEETGNTFEVVGGYQAGSPFYFLNLQCPSWYSSDECQQLYTPPSSTSAGEYSPQPYVRIKGITYWLNTVMGSKNANYTIWLQGLGDTTIFPGSSGNPSFGNAGQWNPIYINKEVFDPSQKAVTSAIVDSTNMNITNDFTLDENHSLVRSAKENSKDVDKFELVLQGDGNLVEYAYFKNGGKTGVWASNPVKTNGNLGYYVSFNHLNGQFGIRKQGGEFISVINDSHTERKGPYWFTLQSDGNIVIYNGKNDVDWASGNYL